MLKVLSDAYVTADAGRVTLLSLLDLSAAFDTVDHQILVERLRRTYGLSARALERRNVSRDARVEWRSTRVRPGSCFFFILYATDVLKFVEDVGSSVHAYADDLQIYGHADPPQSTELMEWLTVSLLSRHGWPATGSDSTRLRLM